MDRAQAHPLPPRDPFTGGPLVITELEAADGGMTIRGRFEVPRFARLSPDQARYLETFLRCRGMLNSVERELGISYPTARARLDAVLKALDLHAVRETSPMSDAPLDEPHGYDEPKLELGLEGEPLQPPEPTEPPTAWESEVAPNEEPGVTDLEWDGVEEPANSLEAPPEETSTVEPEPPAEPEKPRRSRDELLSLLEKGEITVEDLKNELAGKS